MSYLLLFYLFFTTPVFSSIMGISTHPLKQNPQAFSAEMLGHMSQQREMGMGVRYTRDLDYFKRWDLAASGGQNSRSYLLGSGVEVEMVSEDLNRPRVGVKGFFQYKKEVLSNYSQVGFAPNISKGFSLGGTEIFPYIGLPLGLKIDNRSDEFQYVAALSTGVSMPFPGDLGTNVLVNLELNRDLGASSDYIGLLISWMWK